MASRRTGTNKRTGTGVGLRRLTVGGCAAALLVSVLVGAAQAQQAAGCIPTTTRPAVSVSASYDNGPNVAVTIKVRHKRNMASSKTVRVTVDYGDGTTYDATVTVPDSPTTRPHEDDYTSASLAVPRGNHQSVAVTVNGHADYLVCKRHAIVTFSGVVVRVPPPTPTTLPPPEPPPDYVAEIIANSPPRPEPRPEADRFNPDGSVNLYGPGGLLTPERRQAWKCWATFGTAEGC